MTDTSDQKRPSEKLYPNFDNGVYQHLKQAIADYLQWMKSVGYARKTRQSYQAKTQQLAGNNFLLQTALNILKKSQSKAVCRPSMDSHAIYFAKAKYQNLFPTGHRRLIYQKSMKII